MRAALLPFLAMVVAGPAGAAEGPVGMTDAPCPPALEAPASVEAFNRAFLEPGKADLPRLTALTQQADFVAYQAAKAERDAQDPNGLCRYAADNLRLASARRPTLVLFGDSITENWTRADPNLFADGRIVGRGIGGQTSAQMLVRFHADVIALRPRTVQIMAGTNDVAGNGGLTRPEAYRNNVRAMVEIARAHGVRPVLASLPPARAFFWRPQVRPARQIAELNAWLRRYAGDEGLSFIDYHAVLSTTDGGMRSDLAIDGVHPNRKGYGLMRPLLVEIAK